MRTHIRSAGLLSVAVLAPALAGLAAPGALAAPAPAPAASPAGGAARVPMTFTRNDGQAPSGIRYLGATAGVSVAFTDTGITLNLARGQGKRPVAPDSTGAAKPASIGLRFLRANAHPQITGADRSSGTVNDFRGSDPTRWHTNIPTYGQVVYHDLWPGIDGAFSAKNGTLKYSFTLAPGADPDDIRLSYTGAKDLTLDRAGELAIAAGTTVLHDQAPVSYQATGGVNHRITTGYRLLGHDTFGFTVAHHATTAPLTIDPGLEYGTYLGGHDGNASSSLSLGTDAAGDLYVFGQTASASFPSTQGAYQTALDQDDPAPDTAVDFIVTKFDPTGTHLIYSTFVGGSNLEGYAHGVVGSDGAVYVTGESFSSDFPTSANAYRRTRYVAKEDGVAFKLDPTGSRLLYSTHLAPNLVPEGPAVGDDGTLTIAGDVYCDYAPTTPGALQSIYPGGSGSGYVMRLNPTGSGLVFATYVGVPVADQINTSINKFPGSGLGSPAVDAAGDTYLIGSLPAKDGSIDASGLIKLDPSGQKIDFANYIGNPVDGTAPGLMKLAVDKAGNAYVVIVNTPGQLQPTTPDAYQPHCLATTCTGYVEYSPTGSLLYGTYFGGTSASGETTPSDVKVDDDGRVYITGIAVGGTDLPVTPDAFSTDPGDADMVFFLSVLDRGTLLYSTYFGGTKSICVSIFCGFSLGDVFMASAGPGAVYLGGTTAAAAGFPITPGSYQPTYPGGVDTIFAAKLTLPDLPPATAPATVKAALPHGRGGHVLP